jgi:hypothetical protein
MLYPSFDSDVKPSIDEMDEEAAMAALRLKWSQTAPGPVRSSLLTPQRMYSQIRPFPASLSEDPAPS